ncbi:hypothetical protein [Deinococcus planocerae]|uniref:hypothetical protein n=1 Tax=Deinococcus planocerae TaxID=1737569 RepID=UPI000C7EC456|nr:hypothetical protein [Deinococcus planocerae]
MVTYRIFVEADTEARDELCSLLSSAPSGTVVKQKFAARPVRFGEDLYDQLDVVLAGQHAAELSTWLKRRYTTDMQRIG